MENQFQIFEDGKSVGTATVIRQGLYYQISCICHLTDDTPCRINVICGNHCVDLGICVPMGSCFGVRTHIPIKRLGEGELRFVIAGRNQGNEERFVAVESDKPFAYISQLKNARLAVRNGKTGILLSDTHNSISSPTGQ